MFAVCFYRARGEGWFCVSAFSFTARKPGRRDVEDAVPYKFVSRVRGVICRVRDGTGYGYAETPVPHTP